jgi:hypothetical protein
MTDAERRERVDGAWPLAGVVPPDCSVRWPHCRFCAGRHPRPLLLRLEHAHQYALGSIGTREWAYWS